MTSLMMLSELTDKDEVCTCCMRRLRCVRADGADMFSRAGNIGQVHLAWVTYSVPASSRCSR